MLKGHLVKYLYYSRGVVATKERIVIGAGMNVLFALLAIMLKSTHKRLLFEEPGYSKARRLFQLHDYKIRSLKVNADGVDIKELSKEKADLLYLTPSHQYPTGAVIPIANRLHILNWAKENNAYIIEDDSECEFQHKLKLIPALQGIDKYHSVIYFGSFANAIMPSLRISYMVLPEHFIVDLETFEFLMNTVPFTSQQTLAYFMERGILGAAFAKDA
jgi:GntR family transcriptional regulator/MocR family aminotransferase